MATNRRLGLGLAALGMLLVSTDSLFVRLAETDPWTIAFLVACFSVPVQFGLNRLVSTAGPGGDNTVTPDPSGNPLLPMVILAALAAATQLSFIVALTETDVANVVIIVAASPLLAALVAWLVLGEIPSKQLMMAIAATVLGVGLVVAGSIGGPNLIGDALAVLAIVLFACSLVMWRQYPGMNRFVTLGLSAFFMALMALPFVDFGTIDQRVWLATAAMGLVFNPLGRIAHSNAPRYAETAEVALFTPIETVAGTIWAYAFFREVPSTLAIIGGIIVVAGVFYGATRRTGPAL